MAYGRAIVDQTSNSPLVVNPSPGENPSVVRRRPTDIHTIYGESRGGFAPLRVHDQLDRPGRMRVPGTVYAPARNDTEITRAREIAFRRPYYLPAATASGNLNWTAAGPARDLPTFRFNRNVRPIVGGSNQDLYGMHTNIENRGNQLAGKPRMRPAGQNRLTVQRYRGQSYSQTTELAGQ